MTDTAGKYKEVENSMHIFPLVDAVEHCTCNVTDAFCNNPYESRCGECVDKWLESNEHTQSHSNESNGFQVTVVFEIDKANDGSCNRTSPYKTKQGEAPVALITQCNERYRGVTARNVPVNGGMIPFAQSLFPFAPSRQGVVNRRGYIRAKHAEEIENNACCGPSVVFTKAPNEEDYAHNDAHNDASGMTPSIPKLLAMIEMNFQFHNRQLLQQS